MGEATILADEDIDTKLENHAAAARIATERAEAAKNAGKKFYFKGLNSGPYAPLLVLDTYWEAKEMETNPEYVRVTAEGVVIQREEDEAEPQLPFSPPQAEPRKKITLSRKK
jgi:hypothetical protein